jgi:hypothetical protein
MPNRFTIHFRYKSKDQYVVVEQSQIEGKYGAFHYYQIFRDEAYLFSVCRVVDRHGISGWELIEKDRSHYMPKSFIPVLGNWIDQYYLSKALN